MLKFVLHKLMNKRWMALCLLIGNFLIVAVAASNPTYSDAILQRTLTKILSRPLVEENTYPAEVTVRTTLSESAVTDENLSRHRAALSAALALSDQTQIPEKMIVNEYGVKLGRAFLLGERASKQKTTVSVGYAEQIWDHITLENGEMPNPGAAESGVIEAVASNQLLAQLELMMGESLELRNVLQPDGKTPYQLKIVGIYGAKDNADLFWDRNGAMLSPYLIIPEEVFQTVFSADKTYPYGIEHRCSIYLDYTAITPNQVTDIKNAVSGFMTEYSQSKWTKSYENIIRQLRVFEPEATRLIGTLTVLQGPLMVLLAAFIFMVSRQLMELEENEIAVIKSRGSFMGQIVEIYVIQAAILGVSGFILGFPASYLLCSLLGASNAFLEFVHRTALPIRFLGKTVGFGAAAAFISACTMTLPVLRYTKLSIVQHKVKKQTGGKKPLWRRAFLDVVLLGVSLYALHSFNRQKDYIAIQMAEGGSLDPVLYFSSSIFILGAGLLGIRLFPYFIHLVYLMGKKLWSPDLYTAFLRVERSQNSQSFIMVFMILTISLGIFNMSTARSVNGNAERQTVYLNGADVVVKEIWQSGSGDGLSGGGNYMEPSFEKYMDIPGVTNLSKVYVQEAGIVPAGKENNAINDVTIMGINTKEFGETANFDTTLLPAHWYHYLNAISQKLNGVLVSSSFKTEMGYTEGDLIRFTDDGVIYDGVICGFVDYWPAFSPETTGETSKGEKITVKNYLVVANLSWLQSEAGIRPYEVWMKLEGSSQPVYDYARDNNIYFSVFQDTGADLIALKNESVLQGTNGVLTSNFIIVLLLCMVGFLIFWILSIHSRELQFGIFRAMGMSFREVIRMLLCEQILISGSAIGVGVGVGVLATRLYLPLIQLAYSAGRQVLPIRMLSESGDAIRLTVIITLMMVVCMLILAWQISKIKIVQALKLGED